MTDGIKYIKLEWIERPGYKMVSKLPTRFGPTVNEYYILQKTN